VVSAFGRFTLGLSHSIFLTDAMIAPAFPSDTASSGVLYPPRAIPRRQYWIESKGLMQGWTIYRDEEIF
jgi:di/tricarboxylate transporter